MTTKATTKAAAQRAANPAKGRALTRTVTVTCENPQCGNAGHAIEIEPPLGEDGKIDPGWAGVFCGGVLAGGGSCGQQLHTHQPA